MLKKILLSFLLLPPFYISATPREAGLAAAFLMVSAEGGYIAFHKKESSNLEQSMGILFYVGGIIGILSIPGIIRVWDKA